MEKAVELKRELAQRSAKIEAQIEDGKPVGKAIAEMYKTLLKLARLKDGDAIEELKYLITAGRDEVSHKFLKKANEILKEAGVA